MIISGSFWKILTYPLLFLKVMLTSIFRFKLIGYRKSISFHDAVGAVGVEEGVPLNYLRKLDISQLGFR